MACINSSPGNSYERFDGGLERTNRNKAYELGRQVLILEIEEWGRSDNPENSDTQDSTMDVVRTVSRRSAWTLLY